MVEVFIFAARRKRNYDTTYCRICSFGNSDKLSLIILDYQQNIELCGHMCYEMIQTSLLRSDECNGL